MNMSNKVAIFIRGFERTWHWVKDHNFKFFESIYGTNIDWYLATWAMPHRDYNRVLADFTNRNLKALCILDESQYPFDETTRGLWLPDGNKDLKTKPDTYWRIAYLDFVLGNEKVKNEIRYNISYDAVIFTRFDVLHDCLNIELERSTPTPNFFISAVIHDVEDMDYSVSQDWYYKTDSLTADIVSFRFFDTHISDFKKQGMQLSSEVLLTQYLFRNGIIGEQSHEFNFMSYIVRPNQCYDAKLTPNLIDDKLRLKWNHMLADEKIKECIRININPAEYVVIEETDQSRASLAALDALACAHKAGYTK